MDWHEQAALDLIHKLAGKSAVCLYPMQITDRQGNFNLVAEGDYVLLDKDPIRLDDEHVIWILMTDEMGEKIAIELPHYIQHFMISDLHQ